MSAHGTPTDERLLDGDERRDLQERWQRIEERFVDDPAAAVSSADALVERVVERIRTALDDRRAATRQRWDSAVDLTTEQLRETLHRYEVLLDQLADVPAPTGWRDPPSD